MPDIFTPVVILGMFVLGFGFDRLTRTEAIYLVFLIAAAISFHNSHIPLSIGLVLTVAVLRVLLKWPAVPLSKHAASLWPATLIAPITLAVAALVLVHLIDRRQLTIAPDSQIFLLARLIADGPATAYL